MHNPARCADDRLPPTFCWTRFGTEAGESIGEILARKEAERTAAGVFYWGIGNSVGPGIAELLRRTSQPEVLFSPIRGRARPVDVNPSAVVGWTHARTIFGDTIELPVGITVTSRAGSKGTAARHYALVCSIETGLRLSELGRLSFARLRNLVSGRPLGASQVTAVVECVGDPESAGEPYPVSIRARLAPPYFVQLLNPVPVGGSSSRSPSSRAFQLQL